MKKIFKKMFFISIVLVLVFVAPFAASAISAIATPSSSIGIIGGADGPTAILITDSLIFSSPVFWLLCLATVLCIISLTGWLIAKNK